jgi:hypothetical protein
MMRGAFVRSSRMNRRVFRGRTPSRWRGRSSSSGKERCRWRRDGDDGPSSQDPRTGGLWPLKDDDEPRQQPSPPNAAIDQPFEQLTTLLSQLEPAVESSSSLQARNTISALETLVWTSQTQEQVASSSQQL